ncbi:anaerobic ribonucleoside-triphosphate reductase activating protein [Candidatus Falkowbacteria bacterium RIFCSPLOWO2_12_FULL_45_13]|uniref:Anaerobic ribonucleoside-triphosphate reductase activating protein n=2 Tax=Candidatus Falkowiibacteriota TaxID=1752728 RepID=A0A1F5SCI3_9BACT|nr:MAG: anaerobic ribonucleoside-triphosphate reductase activating protein [Candidatus Falkowbacteria bacterium RIFCSPLOWO2_02_FULL_45_21]OGF30570.1 MAG: anaerobic ribonucleoside-triphosphate reductase activating protein [Candidatus Falkowbacteria bacterium RIFCSPLOWO2_12_FULL_45_13]
MLIGALQKFSLLDYPGKISAIVFTQGCNFRCRFCYNPMLVWPACAKASAAVKTMADESAGKPVTSINAVAGKPAEITDAQVGEGKLKYAREESPGRQKIHPQISEDDFFVFLKSRAGKLDAVVITGGEPSLQPDLMEFIRKIKTLGFLIKLDTNGSRPEVLARLIKEKLIDYIAMDLKATPEKYAEITGVEADLNKIKKSVKMIIVSDLPYEFRTTVVPELLALSDFAAMGKMIQGADKWYLQNFKSGVDLVDASLQGRVPYNARQMNQMAAMGRKYVKVCEVR